MLFTRVPTEDQEVEAMSDKDFNEYVGTRREQLLHEQADYLFMIRSCNPITKVIGLIAEASLRNSRDFKRYVMKFPEYAHSTTPKTNMASRSLSGLKYLANSYDAEECRHKTSSRIPGPADYYHSCDSRSPSSMCL